MMRGGGAYVTGGLIDPNLKAALHATIAHAALTGGAGAQTGHGAMVGGGFWSSLKNKAMRVFHSAKSFVAPTVGAFIDKATPIIRQEATRLGERGATALYKSLEHGDGPRQALQNARTSVSRGFDRDSLRRQLLGAGKDVISQRYQGGGQLGGNDAWDSFKTGLEGGLSFGAKLLPFVI